MKLFLFVILFSLINLAYAVREVGEPSKRTIDLNQDLIELQDSNEESSPGLIDLNQDLNKLRYSDCSCRLGSNKRIINGVEAEPHFVPWQVSLANSTGHHFCGAIIINHYYILTSEYCVKNRKKEEIKARVGLHNINDPIPREKTYDVEVIDGFKFWGKFGFMAMLKLRNFIEFIPGKVEPACLNMSKRKIMRHLMVSGWGQTSPTFKELSPVMKIGYLHEIRYNCKARYICTAPLNGDSPYIADNGGPLHSTTEGLTMVEGVLLDFLDESGTNKFRFKGNSIFLRLSSFENLIIKKVGKDYCKENKVDKAIKSESKRKIESLTSPIDVEEGLSLIQDSDCSCRLGSNKRIINGVEAEPHLVPWQVSLANSTGHHFCGAIIINHYYILTSEYCVKNRKKEEIKARVGLHDLDDEKLKEKTYDVDLIYTYSKVWRKYGGIGILRLKHYIEFIPGKIEPACLNLAIKEINNELMVSGWGHTSPKIKNTETNLITFGQLSPILKIAYLDQVLNKCNERYLCTKSSNRGSPYIDDNGGPLHSTRDGLTMVEGVLLDFLDEFGTNKFFFDGDSIFSRLSYYKHWIEEKVGENFCAEDRVLKKEKKRKIESFDDPKGKKKLRLKP